MTNTIGVCYTSIRERFEVIFVILWVVASLITYSSGLGIGDHIMHKALVLFMSIVLLTQSGSGWSGRAAESDFVDSVSRVKEIVENRTCKSNTFLLSDGSYEMVLYSEDKYFKDLDDCFVEIDNSIVREPFSKGEEQYSYANKADYYSARFSENRVKTLVSFGETELTSELSGGVVSSVFFGNEVPQSVVAGYYLGGANCIMYPEIKPGTDVYYETIHGAVKEYIVLKDSDVDRDFQFTISCSGCEYKEGLDNKSAIYALNTSEERFSLGNLFAVDSKGVTCAGLSYLIDSFENGKVRVSFSIPETYLKDDERTFPVLIDPTILISGSSSTYDTCIDQQYPTSNYYLATSLWTGGLIGNNAMRSLIKFDLPSSINASQLTRATLRVQKREYQSPMVLGFRITTSWSSSTATWNNQPGCDTSCFTSLCSSDGGDWYRMDATDLVVGWLNGTYSNYGFLLRSVSELNSSNKTRYYSSDSDYPHRPELVIGYVNSLGSRPYQSVPESMESQTNCMGYALEKEQVITAATLQISDADVVGKTKQQLLEFVASKAEIWMADNLGTGTYAALSAFDSAINTPPPSGWYRVALRVGFDDVNGNGVINQGEQWDFHWKYQTNNHYGSWATKEADSFTWLDSESNGLDPALKVWDKLESTWNYDSNLKYYQIKDIRTIPGWTEE